MAKDTYKILEEYKLRCKRLESTIMRIKYSNSHAEAVRLACDAIRYEPDGYVFGSREDYVAEHNEAVREGRKS